jgi:predicted phage tail component-like protein
MYEFVNLNERGTQSTSLSIQTIFNSNNLDVLLTDENGSFTTLTVSGRSNLTNRLETVEVPGLDGLLEADHSTLSEKEIVIKYKIADKTNEGFRERYNRLNQLLKGAKMELRFTDENYIFFATLSVHSVPEEESNSLVGTLTFLCSNPYKYGPEIEAVFPSDVVSINNNGTTDASPIFELEVLAPVTFAMIQNQYSEYMMIGEPAPAEKVPFVYQELVMHDTCDTLTGWTVANSVDNGYVSGNMKSENGAFVIDTVGTPIEPEAWQGPAIKRSIGASLQDFRMDVEIDLFNVGGNTGMLEIYLEDANNNTVAKIGLEDIWKHMDQIQGKFQLGTLTNRFSKYRTADYPQAWNDFSGILKIYRSGNRIRPYFALIDANGKHVWTSSDYVYTDIQGEYQVPITQIKIAERMFPRTEIALIHVKDIKFWRYNNQPEGIPYLADVGDVITFDHTQNGEVLLNGELFEDVNFGAEFFKLKPGTNTLIVHPSNSFRVKTRFREPHK